MDLARRLDPFPWYRQMRDSDPVHYNPAFESWSVFRYDDVQRVLSDYATFSSRFQGPDAPPDAPLAASLISADPPRHRQLRSLVSQAFTPKAIAGLAPRISSITHELLDRVAPTGRMDVVRDLAYPLPVIVIAELLGIPAEDRERFKRWSDEVVSTHDDRPAQLEMARYFATAIEEHRRQPRNDLISALLDAELDGERLSQLDLLGFCVLLLVAGNETTTNLIGNAILCFDEHPEVFEALRANPDLLPDAIEEVLRYRSPVQSMFRTVVRDTTVGGKELRAGQQVRACIGSANRDDAQFSDPDHFDVRRSPNRHLAFGHGIHFCLGAPLARLEARVALGAMLERLRDLQRGPDVPLEPLDSVIVYGVKSLPVTFRDCHQ